LNVPELAADSERGDVEIHRVEGLILLGDRCPVRGKTDMPRPHAVLARIDEGAAQRAASRVALGRRPDGQESDRPQMTAREAGPDRFAAGREGAHNIWRPGSTQ
jgi:hypothetical protein